MSEIEMPQRHDWKKEMRPALAACERTMSAPASQNGKILIVNLTKDRYFNKFFEGGGKLPRLILQQRGVPKAVMIESGMWRLQQLQAALPAEANVLWRHDNAYLLRLPLMIRAGAGLIVENGQSLRLSSERGVFVINMGILHVSHANLQGWSERGERVASVENDASSRPFVLGWSGSTNVFKESMVEGLGFNENLSQGLTFAVGPIGLAGLRLPAPPRVQVANSRLTGLYNGIHATGVPEVQICGNQFADTRASAIDLDEGSGGVIIGNHVTRNRGLHALIFSKGTRNAWVIDNDISENRRVGIAINGSSGIWLANNRLRENLDAVSVSASENIRFSHNLLAQNQRHGVSLRDARDIHFQDDHIGPNGGVGILAQMSAPSRKNAAARRLELVGVQLDDNRSSAMVIESPYGLILAQPEFLYPGTKRRPVFRGLLNDFERDIMLRSPKKSLQLMPVASAGPVPVSVAETGR